jgi:hypothetical protein
VSSLSDPVKWALDVRNLYENTNLPDYVKTLASPFRSNYDTNKRRQNELLTTLTEVLKSYINETKLTIFFYYITAFTLRMF